MIDPSDGVRILITPQLLKDGERVGIVAQELGAVVREPLVVLGGVVEVVVEGGAQLGEELHGVGAGIGPHPAPPHLRPMHRHTVVQAPRHRPVVGLQTFQTIEP